MLHQPLHQLLKQGRRCCALTPPHGHAAHRAEALRAMQHQVHDGGQRTSMRNSTTTTRRPRCSRTSAASTTSATPTLAPMTVPSSNGRPCTAARCRAASSSTTDQDRAELKRAEQSSCHCSLPNGHCHGSGGVLLLHVRRGGRWHLAQSIKLEAIHHEQVGVALAERMHLGGLPHYVVMAGG